jgi:hypothetical protein
VPNSPQSPSLWNGSFPFTLTFLLGERGREGTLTENHLYNMGSQCNAFASMRKLIALSTSTLLLTLAGAGCTTPSITNLTPSRQPRNPDGFYPVEMAWQSRQQSIKEGSLKPYVVVGEELFPMRPTPVVSNRWEALIPVPATNDLLNYRIKVDFDYYAFPVVRPDSALSKPYQLKVSDR